MKPTKAILILILFITFNVKADRNVYPGTILLHLDSIGNMQFKKNCTAERFNSLIYDYNYTLIRSLIPLEDARAYIKFLRETVVIRPEFDEYSYLIDLAQASLLYMSRDFQGFHKFNLEVKEKLLKQGRISSLFEFEIGLGNFLGFYGNQDSAMEKYKEVERFINQIGFNNLESKAKNIAIVNANALAIGFREYNDLDSAEFYFKLGLQRADLTNRKDWQGIISGNLASFELQNGNTKLAEELLIKDYKQSIKTNQTGSAINALLSLVDLHIQNNNYDKAILVYDTVSILIKSIENTQIEDVTIFKNSLRLRAIKLGIVKGQIPQALDYLDSLYIVLRKEKSKEIRSDRYVIEDNLGKILSLREERKRNLYIFGAFSLIMIVAIVFAFLQKQYNTVLSEKNIEIEKQSQKLEVLNQEKSKLFSVIAHDIRGPIGSLQSLLELFNEKEISEKELIEYSLRIGENLNSLNSMLDNLLNWARAGMDKGIVPKFSEIKLEEFCQEIISQIVPQLSKKKINLNFQITEKILVHTDPALLTVIIRNLLNNAIKFSEPNTHINLIVRSNSSTNKAEISVSDSGKGINEVDLNQLLYSRTSVSSKPGTQGEMGTGLGLMLCKEFATTINGNFSGESTPGKGTTFTVSVPLSKIEA